MYKAPVDDIAFALKKVAGLEAAMEQGLLGELTPDLLDAVLEAGRTLRRRGDRAACRCRRSRGDLGERTAW